MIKFRTTQLSISVDLTINFRPHNSADITSKEMTFGELVLKPKLLHLHALISELPSYLTVVIFFRWEDQKSQAWRLSGSFFSTRFVSVKKRD